MDEDRARRAPGPGRPVAPVLRVGGLLLVAAVLVIAALAVVVRAASTSAGRVTASTRSGGVLGAATVTLDRVETSAPLFFDASGLYPGRIERGCVVVTYDGSVPARLTISGVRRDGTGLERFVELRLVTPSRPDCALAAEQSLEGDEVFSGRLAELWSSATGEPPVVVGTIAPGERVAIAAVATVADDDRAQGLTTGFEIVLEAVPA